MQTTIKNIAKKLIPQTVWGQFQDWRQRQVLARYPRHVVRHNYAGTNFAVELADPLAQGWYDHDWNAPPELKLLRERRSLFGSRVFDLGAHQGVVALMLAELVGPEGQVIAVEPSPHNANQCRRNRDLNARPWLQVIESAVAAKEGRLLLNGGLNACALITGAFANSIEVTAVTIDALTAKFGPPDLLFIDVEGFENQALQGARGTMTIKPDCFVEVHVNCGLERAGNSVEEVLANFPQTDYELWVCSEQGEAMQQLAKSSADCLRSRFFLLALSRIKSERSDALLQKTNLTP